eukprot:TRINITY_DN28564_c0_g1_i1.p1 TRINITY_DN28564_c0_g1~~TRINITY_DN28564_c0_g1_i1.p1  ORF type:complete len:550 (-),score=67.18 TRINITY_DN28564_c0_g1_i1:906-2555(-)
MTSESISITVLDLSGTQVLEPLEVDAKDAVRTARTKVLALQPHDLTVSYPWQPVREVEIELFVQGSPVADGYVLSGPAAELSCIVTITEHPRDPSMEHVISEIEEACDSECVGLYVHGSWLSRYKEPDDVDLLAIVGDKDNPGYVEDAVIVGPFHIYCLPLSDWIGKLQAMDPSILPCLSLPEPFVLKRLEHDCMKNLKIDLPRLRQAVLAFADVKWLSAVIGGLHIDTSISKNGKSRRSRAQSETLACKKIYFAFRALQIGSQLAKSGSVTDFKAGIEWYRRARDLASFLEVDETPEGWDMVQVVFARDFQQAVELFCALCDKASALCGRPLGSAGHGAVHKLRARPQQTSCGLCGMQLVPSGSVAFHSCHLANCEHTFHLRCICDWIRKKYRKVDKKTIYDTMVDYGCWASTYGTRFVPEPGCPVCEESVRLQLDKRRLENRFAMMRLQPLDGSNASLFLPYFELCCDGDRLFAYRKFEEHAQMRARWIAEQEQERLAVQASVARMAAHSVLEGNDGEILATNMKEERRSVGEVLEVPGRVFQGRFV